MAREQKPHPSAFPASIARLLGYLKPMRRTTVVAVAILLAATVTDIVQPMLVKVFLDRDVMRHRLIASQLLVLGGSYLLLTGLSAALNRQQVYLFQQLAVRVVHQIRLDLFGHMLRLPMPRWDRTPVGALVSRMTNDTQTILETFMTVVSSVVQNLALLIGITLAMIWINARLAVIFLMLWPVVAVVAWVYHRVSDPLVRQARELLATLGAKLSESLSAMSLVQAMDQSKRLQTEYGQLNAAYRRVRYRTTQVNALLLRPLMNVLYAIALVGILMRFMRSSGLTVGVLYVFLTYLGRVFEPINTLIDRLTLWQQARVSAARVFAIMDEPSEQSSPSLPSQLSAPPRGAIAFDDVWFSYQSPTWVLQNVSFDAKPGQMVAIVGPTGSGKSTLVSLLLRFYPVTRGRIVIDHRPLDQWSDSALRHAVGWVSQEPYLWPGTVLDNIRFDPSISDDRAMDAATRAQADPFIRLLPEGYHTRLGAHGTPLSLGQCQLIALARALVRDPQILILDEATAHIDSETETLIHRALSRLRGERTLIVIAHRLSTVVQADQILVLQRGKIVEAGTHQALMARQGVYARLYQLQHLDGAQAALDPPCPWESGGANEVKDFD